MVRLVTGNRKAGGTAKGQVSRGGLSSQEGTGMPHLHLWSRRVPGHMCFAPVPGCTRKPELYSQVRSSQEP